MKRDERKIARRCAVYTRVSTNSGLEQDFNSLDNQREASEAYVKSQAHEGWKLARERYDDGGFSGGPMERPAVQKLLDDVRARKIDVIVVYKVDRLTRSLADFAKLVELFDAHGVSFISVTQAFNTTTSMGRLIRVRAPHRALRDHRRRRARRRLMKTPATASNRPHGQDLTDGARTKRSHCTLCNTSGVRCAREG